MKLLEEKTHLDLIYISFHADQHSRMNSVLQYSSFWEGKKIKMKEILDCSSYYIALMIFFFPISLFAAFKARVLFQITQHLLEKGKSIWGNEEAAKSNSRLKAPDVLFNTACVQLAELSLASAFHTRSDIFTYMLPNAPLGVASWLMGTTSRPGK